MILAKPEILRQIQNGRIRIEPYDEEGDRPRLDRSDAGRQGAGLQHRPVHHPGRHRLQDARRAHGHLRRLSVGAGRAGPRHHEGEDHSPGGPVRVAELPFEVRPDRAHEPHRGPVPGPGHLEQADPGDLQRRAEQDRLDPGDEDLPPRSATMHRQRDVRRGLERPGALVRAPRRTLTRTVRSPTTPL
ncbi:MAG: hypothetical protein MZU84_08795 [Sphingobacterium sp.]|nr:hypothetical protein [Sphingobacterium sp.]